MALNFGMPPGFAEALAMKYGIMKMQADAQSNALNAAANKDNVGAALLPKQAAADIAESTARTAGIGETNKTIVPLAMSTIGLQGAETKNYKAQAGSTVEDIITKRQANAIPGMGFGGGGGGLGGYGLYSLGN